MWSCLIRRSVHGRLKTFGKSLPIPSSPHLPRSQFLRFTVASAESSFVCYDPFHFTSSASPNFLFLCTPRFFSSSPFPENEEQSPTGIPFTEANGWNGDSGSGGSIFDSDEKIDLGFGESLISEGSNGVLDSNVESRLDYYENPSPESFEFHGGNQHFDDLPGTNGGADLGAGNESVVMGGEKSDETGEEFVEKLENMLSLLQSRGTGSFLESSLEGVGLLVNEEAVLKVLETPAIPGENLIGFFKWVVKQGEFRLTTEVLDALVKAISHEGRTRDVYGLWDLVNDVGGKEIRVLSTGILNELICLFSNLGKTKAAYEVFTKFENFECVPDEDTYFWIISTLSKRSLFDLACSVCEKMLNEDKLPDSEKVGKVIAYLCRGKKIKDAHTIYMWAKERKKFPSQSTVNCLIRSLCHREKKIVEEGVTGKRSSKSHSQVQDTVSPEERENVYRALEMLNDVSEKERKHAIKSFSLVTKGLCRIEDLAGAKDLLHKMVEMGPPPGYTVFNTLISALSRAGDLEEAKETLKMMEDRGLKPDVYTYSVILAGYVEGGAMEDACKVLDEAKSKHKKLSPCIYYGLIHGYCKLEEFDTALKYMREMKDYGVMPGSYEFNKLIKLLCLKALDWRTAENLLEEMKGSGLRLYGKTKSLVQAVKELEEEGVSTQSLTAAA